jgi:flavorubredoxin
MGEKITLVDTVKAPFHDEMMARIASVVDPADIDYIVSNHAELDHSGALPRVVAETRPSRIFASKLGVKALEAHFHWGAPVEAVATGGELDLGGLTLAFVESSMLHWPDSMVSYLKEERVLFSQDAFGMHLASARMFADEHPTPVLEEEAEKYFANILLPYSDRVAKFIAAFKGLGLPLDIVAPDHGPLWRGAFPIIDWYSAWAEQRPARRAVVVFDTMWGASQKMATAIADGIAATGAGVRIMGMSSTHRSDVATEVLSAGALVVGSPTLNNQMFPTIADVLCYLKGLKPRNLIGAAFGAYGWSGEAVQQIEGVLGEMGVAIAAEGVRVKYAPDTADLKKCRELGITIGEKLSGVV